VPKAKLSAGRGSKPPQVIQADDDIVDLSEDEDLADDALEAVIKNKQEESDILKDLALFDVEILETFIDEWFQDKHISMDDLQLPIGISVTLQGFIAAEMAIAQKVVELKNKIEYERQVFKENLHSLLAQDLENFKNKMAEMKLEFHNRHEEDKGA
jgi:hypothetical protein